MRTYYKNDVLMITDEKKKSITKQSKLIIKNRKTLLKSKLNDDVINIIIVFLYGDKSDKEAFETKFMYFQYVYILRYNIKFCYRNQKENHYLIGDNAKNQCLECKKYCCDDCYKQCYKWKKYYCEDCRYCLEVWDKFLCNNCVVLLEENYDECLKKCKLFNFCNERI